MGFLTSRTIAPTVTTNDLVHIVITGDTSQGNPSGSSYKATIGQIGLAIGSGSTVTISGGTDISVTGIYPNFGISFTGVTSGDYLPLSGGTVSGDTQFTTGLTANTISATTYLNLPINTDVFVTGGTYSAGTSTFTNNTGGTFNVSGFYTGETSNVNTLTTGIGLSADTTTGNITIINTDPDQVVVLNDGTNINVTGSYPNFTIDVTGLTDFNTFTTGFTYQDNTFTITDNSGSTFDATFTEVTGLTVNGDLNITGTTYSNVISATTYQNLPDNVTGNYLPLSGGTVSGETNFTNGLTATTISATTYQNLPINTDVFVTGGTYSAGTVYFTNNTGGTFNVTGLTTGDTTSITGATSAGTGITIFDSVVDRNIQINSITGDTLEKITTSLSANTIEVGINEQNLDLWSLVVQGNRLLSGNVSYISGLTFSISPLDYIIDGQLYNIPLSTQVTLNSGDSTFDRIDVIFADISGNTSILEGTASANPEKPIVDSETQVEVTFVSVPANSTTPAITTELIYDEFTGEPTEWNFLKFGNQTFRISGDSTAQSYSGSKSISVSGLTTFGGSWSNGFLLSATTLTDTNQFATLQFAIRNMSGNSTNTQIRIRFLNQTGVAISSPVYLRGGSTTGQYINYSTSNTSSWQLISIPLWKFYLTNTNVYGVRFDYLVGSIVARHYFDKIEFVEGVASSPPSNSWTTIKGDGTTTITAPNPNATLTISGGTNISSSISGTSTVVLNLDNNINLNGLTATTISATTYQNLPVSGLTGGSNINVSGSSGNITISVTGITGGSTFTGGTVSGSTNFTNGLTANTISATTYQNLPVSGLTEGNNINISGSNGNYTISVTGLTQGLSGDYLPLSGGTVTGGTSFTSGLTASTISATTYQNLPINTDVFVTGGTYSSGNTTFTNNTGGTFNVTGFYTGETSYVNSLTTGSGLSADTTTGNITIINTNPDQTVTISGGTGITTGGTYPNFTITNSAPDQTVTLSEGTNISVTGIYPNFTLDVTGLTDNDVFITGFTYDDNNKFTISKNSGSSLNAIINLVSGLTVNGDLSVTGNTNINNLSATTISATTYQNLPDNVTGNYLPLSGGTVSGDTTITANLTVSGNSGINWFSSNTSSDLVRITQTGNGNAFVVEDSNNPDSTPFIINTSGNTSIGSNSFFTTPGSGLGSKLSLSLGASGYPYSGLPISTAMAIESNQTTAIGLFSSDINSSQIYFGTPGDVFGAFLRWDFTNKNLVLSTANSNGKLVFQTGLGTSTTEAARIDQNGNMGIGLTGATQKLEVSGNTRIYGGITTDTISATTANTSTLVINTTPTTDPTNNNVLVRNTATGMIGLKDFTHYNFGFYVQTGDSATVVNTTTETSILDAGIGTLSIPANGFSPGDSFHVKIGGMVSANNGDAITLNVKSGSVILATDIITFTNGVTNKSWEFNSDFTIRTIGGPTIGSIMTNGTFMYNVGSDIYGGGFNTLNNTTFDTTASNTLDFTVTWGTASAGNSIYSSMGILKKTF